MENYLNPYDMECMRIAMVKHEETFKEQVNELHRLYRTQKILMRNFGPKNHPRSHQEAHWRLEQNGFSFRQNNVSQPRIQEKSTIMEAEVNFNEPNGINTEHIDDSEIEIELTLGLGPTNYTRTRINKNPGTSPLTSDSGWSFSSSSTGSSHINRAGTKAEEGPGGYRRSLSKSSIDVEEEQLRQERLKQQPPWLFQVLSLNMT